MSVVSYISEERLKTYEKFTDRRERAIALHNQTLQLGASLMSTIALFELALRNSANSQIAKDFGSDDWLISGKQIVPLAQKEKDAINTAIRHAQKSAYSKLSHKEKHYLDVFAFPTGAPKGITHEKRTRARQSLFVITQGQVIAQTTLHFWKRLFAPEYEATLWRMSLKRVFPNKKLKRSDISRSLEKIYAARNRVAHHEPVYGDRLEEVIQALDFMRKSLGAKADDPNPQYMAFARLQHLRLHVDYEHFKEAWATLAK